MKNDYFRFWEKDLVKGYHYIFSDAHVDIWANMNMDYMVTYYTLVLHVPSQPELLRTAFCEPSDIRDVQQRIISCTCLNHLITYFKTLHYVPQT